ncbi:MAG: hypothetical protein A3E07_00925 [Candidatus Wildermuthbacteria bacterium RIFCSPHIGHO2_12_FULL_45_9]|uniref:Uncharacterized protein n=1 Tax=Candidatus Wildermuthbacteria bacterium RIFCSPHIGHO2_02_FULL_45_25 TaxID=1802450 RepID=A0A1G2R1F1_9BACT|nr:MAG: hypothetical protein A2748_00845 [Candidatus Wildermuthbacteria bacterium RIFCSPHIGHO2_01_FULL_45_20]OHA66428.1 MAG: hypothetical protein A3C04_01215 [Candidatus Wildermuthbacteria bacterium RIFCSPHIGHO2_02_FULL_45_25]OHA71434.1 MAG: hypothetical protein A3E07_00925 [Candidatus Wildermuthbacteria bacterium RIFCSPHIGHO2_12_FULL_45_9]
MKRSFMQFLLFSAYRNKFLWGFGMFSTAILVVLYIMQLNSITQLAYDIAESEQEIETMEEHIALMQETTVQTMSYQNMEELAGALGFERINHIEYIKVPGGAVARQQ